MKTPYPPLQPFQSGFLQVDDIHGIYYEQSGNPNGVPVVFFHGGPGAGSVPRHRQFFDPEHYRIVIFDQRGCGKSRPHAELRNNTTDLLIADAEKLRQLLHVEKWHVFGGSWGSTLSLAYAIRHPDRVISMTLRGVFLMTRHEIDLFLYGMKSVFPEAWDKFVQPVPEDERKNILAYYFKILTGTDEIKRLHAAQAWAAYETSCCALFPSEQSIQSSRNPHYALTISRIEAHYFTNNLFNPENYILENIDRVRHIPTTIIQGRYDMICPIETAYKLHKTFPEAKFNIIPDAGHSAFEPGIFSALTQAMDDVRHLR